MRLRGKVSWCFGTALAILVGSVPEVGRAQERSAEPLRVTSITPSGENVPVGRQIVFQFNRPVAPIGRMSRDAAEIPVEIRPALDCRWRWIDPSALACQLGDDQSFVPATRYDLTLRPGLRARDGGTLPAAVEHWFATERPGVVYAGFRTWRAPGLPVIRVIFNQPVSNSSVAGHMFVAAGGNRRELRVEPDEYDREQPRFVPLPGEPAVLDFGRGRTAHGDDRTTEVAGEEARRIWLVSPEDELAADLKATLGIEPGLVSAEGPLRGTEQRPVVEFHTFPEYRLLGIVCTGNSGADILVPNGSPPAGAAPDSSCNPMSRVGLAFSAPTIASEVRDRVRIVPDLANGRTDYDPWANAPEWSRLYLPHERGRRYVVYLPERLRAAALYRIDPMSGSEGPRDEFGRTLAEPIDVNFRTDHRPPNYTIAHPVAVAEAGIDSALPLYVTNLESAALHYRRLTVEGSTSGLTKTYELPAVEDVQYAVPLGIRDLLEGRDGVIYGNMTSDPGVGVFQDRLFAQVTPFQVHVKLGHFNTLVWVTDLATGRPVANAAVSVHADSIATLSADYVELDAGRTDRRGVAILAGTAELDPPLNYLFPRQGCWGTEQDTCERLFVRVQYRDRMAVLPIERRFEVSTGRVSNYTIYSRSLQRYGHLHSWGTTAQGVYRAGDTIDYKIYVRDQSNDAYVPPPDGPYSLDIIDSTGKTVHSDTNILLSAFGAFDGRYRIPGNAAVGWYTFRLNAEFLDSAREPVRVLVTDFTPSSFRVTASLNGDTFVAGAEVEVETQAALFSGGPYIDAETRVTAVIDKQAFRSTHPVAAAFRFDSAESRPSLTVSQVVANVGEDGRHLHRFQIPRDIGDNIVFGTMRVESAVRDDRGRYVAGAASARFLAVDRLVGLRNTRWTYSEDEEAAIGFIVVDTGGAPVAGTDVRIDVQRLETRAARVRGAGNAYLTQFVNTWVDVARCEALSEASPGTCSFVPGAPGRYRATALIRDTSGGTHSTRISAWVTGKGHVVWNTSNDDSLQIVPEQTRHAVGDTARYLIQNPYPGARALVTIERYGVLKQWVETLDDSTPIIEFEVEEDFLPGFFLSVLVSSPRVAAPLPEPGEVDLGKPAFKLGYVQVPVDDPYKQIEVEAVADRVTYKPRDTVRVSISARPRHRERSEPIEAAVVVLDEAVLDLIRGGPDYFDPYSGFYDLDGLDVRNYSLLTRLVGRQRIELKGANAGGDGGGNLNMRSLFDHVAYWNPSLELNRRGRGEFEFELPDNLTGWRVLVLATTPTDRMGLGKTTFTVNLPTEIRPVMPNQVTEGDRFLAGFSVMNRTERTREIDVSVAAGGHAAATPVSERRLILQPYRRDTVFVPVEAARLAIDRNREAGSIRFEVRAGDAFDGDAMAHELPVRKLRVLETSASFGSTVGEPVNESLLFPPGIHTDAGEIGVELSASVIANLDGAFRYIRDLRYPSWEHKLSQGVMASHFERLRAWLNDDLAWPGSAELPARMLADAASHQAPNGGMSYFIPADAYVSPYLSAYTALAFNWLRQAGYRIPAPVETRLHEYLENLLRRNAVPSFYTRGMTSSVRAVALAALAPHGRLSLGDLLRYRGYLEHMSLFGKAHYLLAALTVDGAEGLAREAVGIIMRSSVRSAGLLSFNETLDDGYARILSTPMRANCAILSALTAAGDMGIPQVPPALLRTVTQRRQERNHWENIQENMFCMNALIDYSQRYESVDPNLTVSVEMDGETIGTAAFTGVRDPAVYVSRPIADDDPGRQSRLTLLPSGDGRLYYGARMTYAAPDSGGERIDSGIDVRREYSVQRGGRWVLLENDARVRRGELVRVDLFVSLPAAGHFIVVDDPVPGGLEPVNRDLQNASFVDADAGDFERAGGSWWFQFGDWHYYDVSRWSFHHKELRHDAARFFSDYLPPGNYQLSYTAQAIAEGEFHRMPVKAEAMYDPGVHGAGLQGSLTVTEP